MVESASHMVAATRFMEISCEWVVSRSINNYGATQIVPDADDMQLSR